MQEDDFFTSFFKRIFCRGCAGSREDELQGPSNNEIEQYIYEKECDIKLQKICFENYHGAIKRFGYRSDLNQQHLRAISREINMNNDEMFNNTDSIFNIQYESHGFTYDPLQKKYNVQNMLKVGFIHCYHYSADTQNVDLWHLINPKLDDTVPREVVINFLKDLVFIAVDLMEKYLRQMGPPLIEQGVQLKGPTQNKYIQDPKSDLNTATEKVSTEKQNSRQQNNNHDKKSNLLQMTKEQKQEELMKMRAIKYMKLAKKGKQQLYEDLESLLPEHVSKVDLIPVVRNRFLKTHQIRALLTQNDNEDNVSLRSIDVNLGKSASKGAVPGPASNSRSGVY